MIKWRSGEGGTSAIVIQFPVRLAFALTAHKIQGQTIPKQTKVVLLDKIGFPFLLHLLSFVPLATFFLKYKRYPSQSTSTWLCNTAPEFWGVVQLLGYMS